MELVVVETAVGLSSLVHVFRAVVVINAESLSEEINRQRQVDEPEEVAAHCNRRHHAGSVLRGDEDRVGDRGEVEVGDEGASHDRLVVDDEENEEHQVNHGDRECDDDPDEEENVQIGHGALLDA